MLSNSLSFIGIKHNVNSRLSKRISPIVRNAYNVISSDNLADKVVTHPSYEVIDSAFIEEYGLKAILYSHKKSGAEVMSVLAKDENKVFGITFRTPPNDSTGIPHILEVTFSYEESPLLTFFLSIALSSLRLKKISCKISLSMN
jgi:hypothetical protein